MEALPSAVLVVLDGWGLAPDGPGNAVSLADTPVFDALWERYPHTTLTACGESVGLQDHEGRPQAPDPLHDLSLGRAVSNVRLPNELPLTLCEPIRLALHDSEDGKRRHGCRHSIRVA